MPVAETSSCARAARTPRQKWCAHITIRIQPPERRARDTAVTVSGDRIGLDAKAEFVAASPLRAGKP